MVKVFLRENIDAGSNKLIFLTTQDKVYNILLHVIKKSKNDTRVFKLDDPMFRYPDHLDDISQKRRKHQLNNRDTTNHY